MCRRPVIGLVVRSQFARKAENGTYTYESNGF